jgi:hypothetical protein
LLIGIFTGTLIDQNDLSLEDIESRVQVAIAATQMAQPTSTDTPIPTSTYTPFPTPDVNGTIQAAIDGTQATQPTNTATLTPSPSAPPLPTPDISSTVLAAVIATLEAQPSATPYPTYTPYPPPEPIVQLETTTFTPIPIQLTNAPVSVLEVGQTWRQGEVEATLKEARLNTSSFSQIIGVYFNVYFTNRKPDEVALTYSLDNFKVTDNYFEKPLPLNYFNPSSTLRYGCGGPQTYIVKANETIVLGCASEDAPYVLASFDIGDKRITEVVISISDISDIVEARWRMPIKH